MSAVMKYLNNINKEVKDNYRDLEKKIVRDQVKVKNDVSNMKQEVKKGVGNGERPIGRWCTRGILVKEVDQVVIPGTHLGDITKIWIFSLSRYWVKFPLDLVSG